MPSIEDYDDFPVNQKGAKGGGGSKKKGGNPNGKYTSKHVRKQQERTEKALERQKKKPNPNGK